MELKSTATKFETTPQGEITGYAAAFGNRDSHGDVILPGAFTRTISNDRGRIKVLWQHDSFHPIGAPVEMREDDYGLAVKAQIADTTVGRDALALIRAGVVSELSIGYDTIREERDDKAGVRNLLEVRVWEFSPVTWASNELAKITAVKHASDLDAVLDRLERVQWVSGRLESPRLREKAELAVKTLSRLLEGDTPNDQDVAAPPGTPLTTDVASDPVHAALGTLSALNQKLRAATFASELRAFGETLRRTN